MSRNFELMQQARMGICGSTARSGDTVQAEPKSNEQTVAEVPLTVAPAVREESLKLVQRLFLTPGQKPARAVVFAAVDSKSGCSRLCAITSKLLAESVRGSVCLLEGNLRAPSLPQIFSVQNNYGLADCLRQEGDVRQFARPLGRDNLWLLSSGSVADDSLSLLHCDLMKERFAELRKSFDYLLIDGPPLNAYADAMTLGRLADGVVLVLEANATRREAALRVADSLRAAEIPVLGVVLNKRTFPIPTALYKRI
jgi:polysaccharide biosynthesis transport protein